MGFTITNGVLVKSRLLIFRHLPQRIEVELVGLVSFLIEDMGLGANVLVYEPRL